MSKHRGGHGPYAPKLTFDQRCGYLAAAKIGASPQTIIAATGLNRGTVTKLSSKGYNIYADVHAEYDRMGKEAFVEKYLTQEIQDSITVGLAAVALAQAAGDVHTPRCTATGAAGGRYMASSSGTPTLVAGSQGKEEVND